MFKKQEVSYKKAYVIFNESASASILERAGNAALISRAAPIMHCTMQAIHRNKLIEVLVEKMMDDFCTFTMSHVMNPVPKNDNKIPDDLTIYNLMNTQRGRLIAEFSITCEKISRLLNSVYSSYEGIKIISSTKKAEVKEQLINHLLFTHLHFKNEKNQWVNLEMYSHRPMDRDIEACATFCSIS